MKIGRLVAGLLGLGLALTLAAVSIAQQAAPPNPSPLGLWRGSYKCGGTTSYAELKITHEMFDLGRVEAEFKFNDDNKILSGIFWSDGAYTLTVNYDARTRTLNAVPLKWTEAASGFEMVGMTLTLAENGARMDGRVSHPQCGAMTLTRTHASITGKFDYSSATVYAKTPAGQKLQSPNAGLAGSAGLTVKWDGPDSCSPPTASIRITEMQAGALDNTQSWRELAERTAKALEFMCPGAEEVDVFARPAEGAPNGLQYMGPWSTKQWQTWQLARADLGSAQRRGPTPPAPGLETIDTLTTTNRDATAKARLTAAYPAISGVVAQAYAKASLGRADIFRQSELAAFAANICFEDDNKVTTPEGAKLRHQACLVRALWQAGYLAKEAGAYLTSGWKDTAGGTEFSRCFYVGGPVNCALIAEYAFEAYKRLEDLVRVRDARATAQASPGDFEGEVVGALKGVAAASQEEHRLCIADERARFATKSWANKQVRTCSDSSPTFNGCKLVGNRQTCSYTCTLTFRMSAADYCAEASCRTGKGSARKECDGPLAWYIDSDLLGEPEILPKPTAY